MKKLKYLTPIYNFYSFPKKLPIPKFPYILCLSIYGVITMIHTVHHTHIKGTTLSVIPKAFMSESEFLRLEGHIASCEIAKYKRGKSYFFIQYSADILGLGEEYVN